MAETIVCIGTGPSLTLEQIEKARARGFRLYGCNRVFEIVPDLEALYGCNLGFWETYGPAAANHPCSKWTSNREAADRYQLNWLEERGAPGLSTDPGVIHHGHGSGYSLVNLAYLHGADRIVLLGYDLRYPQSYDGAARQPGGKRHYWEGGEYPAHLQHWPTVKIERGVHRGLLELYQGVADQGLVEIVNATPGSALTCFPVRHIRDL